MNIALAALVAAGLPFLAFTHLVLVHFYAQGSFVLDSGLLASLIWHSDAALSQPASVGGGSYFGIHVALLFGPLSWLSRWLPLSMAQFYAGFIGAGHAALAMSVFWLLVAGYGLRRRAGPWIAAAAAIGFAFSGLAIAIARYPHFETLIAAFFLLFACAQLFGHRRLAIMFFVLGLMTREDAGFHYLAVLGLVVFVNLARGADLRSQRGDLAYALAALAYALAAMTIQRLLFPDGSAFVRVYGGDPLLAHVNTAMLGERAQMLLIARPYVVYPACGAVLWAIAARNPLIVIGYAANLPWLAVHLLAKSPLAGVLVSYYAFPFLVALAWPLIAILRTAPPQARAANWRVHVTAFAALLALTFVPAQGLHDPGRLALPRAFWTAPSRAQQKAADSAVAAIVAARPMLGRLAVGNSVAALAPRDFSRDEVPFLDGGDASPALPPAAADTLVYFADGYDAARLARIVADAKLAHCYAVASTPILIASRRDLVDVPALAALTVPVPCPSR